MGKYVRSTEYACVYIDMRNLSMCVCMYIYIYIYVYKYTYVPACIRITYAYTRRYRCRLFADADMGSVSFFRFGLPLRNFSYYVMCLSYVNLTLKSYITACNTVNPKP